MMTVCDLLMDKTTNIPIVTVKGEFDPGREAFSPEDVDFIMRNEFNADRLPEEHAWIICMNNRCEKARIFEISHGTDSNALTRPKEVLVRALLSGASKVIFIHNHPSGNVNPSRDDAIIVCTFIDEFRYVGIEFEDSIIIGENGFYSFRTERPTFWINENEQSKSWIDD